MIRIYFSDILKKISKTYFNLSDRVIYKTLSSKVISFRSTSDEPLKEKVFANLVPHSLSSIISNDFKVIESIKNLNIPLNDWSSSNLVFNELIAISTTTKSN